MALYTYKAFNHAGKQIAGSIDATSHKEARDKLIRSGLLPTHIDRAETAANSSIVLRIRSLISPTITTHDVIFFTKQLSVLLKAGIPLLPALELLIEQTEKNLQNIIIELKDLVKEGRSLADGLERYPKAFDTTYVQLVRAGEASGKLETILDRLIISLERNQELSKKLKEAARLPLIQLTIVLIVTVILLTIVVPQIATVFASQKVALPLATLILLTVSDFLQNHYIALLIGTTVIGGLFLKLKSTDYGARMWDTMLLKIPLLNYFIRTHAVVQFSSTLGMLTESGVNLAESLTIVCNLINNRILIQALQDARDKIIKQGKITVYLKETGLFPPLALYLIRTGEESGQLGSMLLTVAQTFDSELREKADGLTALLNPIMFLITGFIVGFVVIAIGKPIMQLGDVAAAGVKNIR